MVLEGTHAQKLPVHQGTLRDDDLCFDSDFDSANLMAVFRIGEHNYDLFLQNDVNTSGFTQWYNFKVTSRRPHLTAHFNIVNLYKSKSLYSQGMKPAIGQQRQGKVQWTRRGQEIVYQRNDLRFEDEQPLYYHTLSFAHHFHAANEAIQLAHAQPYDQSAFDKLLQTVRASAKVTLRSIGSTPMGKSIHLIKIAAADRDNRNHNLSKKAIIIMARQHPG